ncbi:MAG: hypothetical protein M1820_005884 [Bogoriella megaspora]|nr:MAG: hypothetical protein M1820_005884 [Bogoriella megaspora]
MEEAPLLSLVRASQTEQTISEDVELSLPLDMRSFSTAAANFIKWSFNGTTHNVTAALDAVEQGVKSIPGLADKVEKGIINGDPHPTNYPNGTQDPVHLSGVLGNGNLKGSKRATSFHYYPETGDLTFSDTKYQAVRVPLPSSSSILSQAPSIPAHQQASGWVWDENERNYRYWNGSEWIWQQQ